MVCVGKKVLEQDPWVSHDLSAGQGTEREAPFVPQGSPGQIYCLIYLCVQKYQVAGRTSEGN